MFPLDICDNSAQFCDFCREVEAANTRRRQTDPFELRIPRKMAASSATGRSRADIVQKRSQSLTANGYTTGSAAGHQPGKINGAQTVASARPETEGKWDNVTSGVVQSTLPAWFNIGIIASLIFGGCCANVSVARMNCVGSADFTTGICAGSHCPVSIPLS